VSGHRHNTREAGVGRWVVATCVVYVAIALTGVWIASLGQDVRGLFVALERNQQQQDALLAEYSRLLLERGTLASYQNVDQIAERRLAMRFPEQVERVSP
jgi:cell division protein FtsL